MKTQNVIPHDPTTILSMLKDLFNRGQLFTYRATNDSKYEKVSLHWTGQVWVHRAVERCISFGVIPNCAVNSDNGTIDTKVISLNQKEYEDLLSCLEQVIAKQK